jgi:hypothetical protein
VAPSARTPEQVVALREEVAIGLEMVGARHVGSPALEALQPVQEHRRVDLLPHVEGLAGFLAIEREGLLLPGV